MNSVKVKAHFVDHSLTKEFPNEYAAHAWMDAMRGIYKRDVAFDTWTLVGSL